MDDPQHDIPMHPTDAPGLTPGASSRPAPPTEPGAIAPVEPKWPTVIGVLAIVFSSISALSSVVGFFAQRFVPPAQATPMTPFTWALSGLGVIALLLHFVGGVQIIRRTSMGARALIWWAWFNSALVVATAAYTIWALSNTQMPSTLGAPPAGFFFAMMLLGFAMSLIWPVFLLIFLNRPARRAHWKSWR